MILLFDTDVIIDILRGIENTVFQVEDIVGETDLLACSVITVKFTLACAIVKKKTPYYYFRILLKNL
jgi:predicted nucleic acid-binding protein